MKPDEIKNITLSYACNKNWNEMEQVAGGRFCDSCQHVVHDFTTQNDCHLKKILSENKRVCGKFKRSQMSSGFLKYAAATMIAASGATMSSCIEKEIIPSVPEQQPETEAIKFDEVTVSLVDTTEAESFVLGIVFIEPDSLNAPE